MCGYAVHSTPPAGNPYRAVWSHLDVHWAERSSSTLAHRAPAAGVPLGAAGYAVAWPVVLAPLARGDWWDAAQLYRAWALARAEQRCRVVGAQSLSRDPVEGRHAVPIWSTEIDPLALFGPLFSSVSIHYDADVLLPAME